MSGSIEVHESFDSGLNISVIELRFTFGIEELVGVWAHTYSLNLAECVIATSVAFPFLPLVNQGKISDT
jgi:hypothetical protein